MKREILVFYLLSITSILFSQNLTLKQPILNGYFCNGDGSFEYIEFEMEIGFDQSVLDTLFLDISVKSEISDLTIRNKYGFNKIFEFKPGDEIWGKNGKIIANYHLVSGESYGFDGTKILKLKVRLTPKEYSIFPIKIYYRATAKNKESEKREPVSGTDLDQQGWHCNTITLDFDVPRVKINDATEIQSNKATLNGLFSGSGIGTICYYEFGTSEQLEFKTQTTIISGTTWYDLPEPIANLKPDTDYYFRMVAYHQSTQIKTYSKINKFHTLTGVSDVEIGNASEKFILFQNYPNPFNPQTTIPILLPETKRLEVYIINICGQRIQTYQKDNLGRGLHIINADLSQFCSGIYFYFVEIKTSNGLILKKTGKMEYLK